MLVLAHLIAFELQVRRLSGFVLSMFKYSNQDVDNTRLAQDEVIGSFEFYAGLAEKLEKDGDHDLKVPDETMNIVVKKEPLGVCALITPWNVSIHLLLFLQSSC